MANQKLALLQSKSQNYNLAGGLEDAKLVELVLVIVDKKACSMSLSVATSIQGVHV